VGQHREDSAVIVFALGDAELHQDVAHVRLDRALAQVEPPGDACVGQALRHELEHLALRQLRERVVFAARSDETPDDVRIEREASAGDTGVLAERVAARRRVKRLLEAFAQQMSDRVRYSSRASSMHPTGGRACSSDEDSAR
jgi:hypothetical protein